MNDEMAGATKDEMTRRFSDQRRWRRWRSNDPAAALLDGSDLCERGLAGDVRDDEAASRGGCDSGGDRSIPATAALLEGRHLCGRGLTGDSRDTELALTFVGLPWLACDLGVGGDGPLCGGQQGVRL
jgi:hypothetical protein